MAQGRGRAKSKYGSRPGAPRRSRELALYLNTTGPDAYTIVDDDRREYTPAAAASLWAEGKVTNYNLSFWRLVQNRFDLDAVRAYFAAADAADRARKEATDGA